MYRLAGLGVLLPDSGEIRVSLVGLLLPLLEDYRLAAMGTEYAFAD
jgi:hypothetical protein